MGLHHYKVSFYEGCDPKESSACHTAEPSLAYVVFYDYDPSMQQGFVYLPGGHDEFARLNRSAIYRGPGYEGHWFRAARVWDNFLRPIIANEAPRLTTFILQPLIYGLVQIGNTVVATIQVDDVGTVRNVQLLEGVKPFTEAAVQAISQWKFQPAHRDGHAIASEISVVMMFRPPFRNNFGVGGTSLGFIPHALPEVDHPVLPMYVFDPGWSASPLFNPASVVFELDIRDSGSIAAIRVVRGVPFTADFAKEAVRQWDFTSAVKDRKPIPSRTIVVISWRIGL